MKHKYSLIFITLLCAVLSGYGQVIVFNEDGSGTLPTGWIGTNNVTTNDIDRGTYYLVDAGNPGDLIETDSYDLSAYTSAIFEVNITSFGGGSHRGLLVEVSTDGGASFTQNYTTPITTGNYATRTINIPTVSSNTVLRFSVDATSGRGIRLQNLMLTAISPTGPTVTATPSTITGLDYVIGAGPSAEQIFNITGNLLTLGTTVTSTSTDFEVSLTPVGGYANSVTIPAGTLNGTTTIYTRLVAGLPVNTYSSTLTIANLTPGIGTTPTIPISGEVTLPSGSNCSELFISEYVEGSSNNKYIEIYNPTNAAINLSGYQLATYFNGNTTPTTLGLSGTINSYSTYVIGNSNAALAVTPDLFTPNTVMNFNGNDAIALQTSGDVNIDVIGEIGNGAIFAENTTLRKKSTVQNPNTTYSNTEWDSFPENDVSGLGNHTSDCQAPSPEIQLVDNTTTNQNCGFTIDFGPQENATNTDLTFNIDNVGSADLDITSLNITGDYTLVSPVAPLTILSGNSQTVTVRFTPSTTGTRTGVLTINSNDSDEGTCTVSLTGEGFTPAPEINIEGNLGTFPDITGDASNVPSGFNNTLFAARPIATSEAKSFRINNEGTATLNISSITIGGSNPGDFTITGTPPATTIAANGIEILEITFTPLASGVRTATVIINSNDSDEDPFVFNIQGTGECNSATYTLSPSTGPAGTIVTVTTSSGSNPNSSTALYDGLATTITNLSPSSFEITIPNNAISSDITFNDVTGCTRYLPFTVIESNISSCEGSGTLPTDIFISEVTDRDSSIDGHSYIELFNGTGAPINISNYTVEVHSNGSSSAISTVNIPNGTTLANGDTYVISFGTGTNNVDPVSQNDYFSSNTIGINDSDHLILTNGSTDIDLWGDTSGNPFTGGVGTEYNGTAPNGSDYTYRRRNSGITAPSLTWNPSDWILITPLNYSDIGNYNFSVGTPPSVTLQPSSSSSTCDLTAVFTIAGSEGFPGGNSLTYQWYFSAPGDTNWYPVPNTAPYSGFNTPTLDISNTLSLDGYQYYCQIREDSATCFTATNAIMLHANQAIWTSGAWSNTTGPDSFTIAIINDDYNTTLNGSFSACQLLVNAGNELVITDGHFVEVINNVIVNGDGTNLDGILVEDKGSFVQRGNGVNAGTYTLNTNARTQVNKKTAALNNWFEYTYWSSPVINETIGNGLNEAHPTRRYWYNAENYLDATAETNNNNGTVAGQDDVDDNGNDWQTTNNLDIMIPGRGYAAMHNPIGFGMPGANYEYTFEGALNTGDYVVPIYRNDSELNDNNWNFIGNPYPSAINADLFLSANALIDQNVTEYPQPSGVTNGAIFLWSQNSAPSNTNNGNEALNFAQSDYAVINGTGQTAGGDGVMPSRFIPSGQGFFITLSDAATVTTVSGDIKSGDVIFQNSMRVTGNNNQFFRDADNYQNEKLWLNFTSDMGVFNQILIGYVEGATDANDGMYFDAPKNLSSDSFVYFYSLINNESEINKVAIQGKAPESLDLDEVISLGFSTTINQPSIYSIGLAQLEGDFLNTNTVYLKDLLLNVTHNLSLSEYHFTSSAGEFNNRFKIVFRENALSVDEYDVNNNHLTIVELTDNQVKFSIGSTNTTIKSVEIIDMLGRILYKFKGSNSSETYNLTNLSSTTYLAKVTLSNNQVLVKKAVKK